MSKPDRDELVAAIEVLFAKRRDKLSIRQLRAFGRTEWEQSTAGDVRGEAAEVVADAILGLYEPEDDGR